MNKEELGTEDGKMLIDQISDVSKPILVLSGGEPLLRRDIFELAHYGTERGLKVVMGTNGVLITDEVTGKLKNAGVIKVAVSLVNSLDRCDADCAYCYIPFEMRKKAYK